MHGGFRRLIHPGTPANDIDVDGTREERARINEQFRQQLRVVTELEAKLNGTIRPADDSTES